MGFLANIDDKMKIKSLMEALIDGEKSIVVIEAEGKFFDSEPLKKMYSIREKIENSEHANNFLIEETYDDVQLNGYAATLSITKKYI